MRNERRMHNFIGASVINPGQSCARAVHARAHTHAYIRTHVHTRVYMYRVIWTRYATHGESTVRQKTEDTLPWRISREYARRAERKAPLAGVQ